MSLTFHHTFTTGHRAILSLSGPEKPPRFAWPDGMPPLEVVDSEYLPWIRESFQHAANTYGGAILYFLPKGNQMTQLLFLPETTGPEPATP